MRHSRIVVAWLRLVLKDHPRAAGTYEAAAQHIPDGLAAAGHEAALRLQHEWKPDAGGRSAAKIPRREHSGSLPVHPDGQGNDVVEDQLAVPK